MGRDPNKTTFWGSTSAVLARGSLGPHPVRCQPPVAHCTCSSFRLYCSWISGRPKPRGRGAPRECTTSRCRCDGFDVVGMGDGPRGISLGSSGDPINHMWVMDRCVCRYILASGIAVCVGCGFSLSRSPSRWCPRADAVHRGGGREGRQRNFSRAYPSRPRARRSLRWRP